MTDSHNAYGSDPATHDDTCVHRANDDAEQRTSDPVAIDCDSCDVRGLACGDCVVTVLLGAPPAWLDEEEQRAIGVLAESGLIPPLRLVASEGATVTDRGESALQEAQGTGSANVGEKISPRPWRAAPEVRGTG